MMQNNCKRRSSLRKTVYVVKDEGVNGDDVCAANNRNSTVKRRISFSEKKFVREFNNTEKPHEWDNSYELSDHTNGEESGTVATGYKSSEKVLSLVSAQEKENVSLNSFQVDSTFNLQTSIDITLLPSELKKRAKTGVVTSRPAESPRESLTRSLFLSPTKRDQLKGQFSKYPILDRTVDLFPDCPRPPQKQTDQMLEFPAGPKDSLIATSNLNITKPLLIPPKLAPVDNSPLSNLPVQSTDLSKCKMSKMQTNSNICYTSMDVSFDMQVLNNDMHLDSIHSSPLIPMDMIGGEGISGPMNLRQLNEAIEAGNIRVCPNGPKTPTTDRKAKYSRFWKGVEQESVERGSYGDSIKKLKAGTALNFNDSVMISPAPVPKSSVPDDKRKYRYSQADEMLLDNTNFLAYAKLSDETQSLNSSRHAESTYMANSNSKLEVEHTIHFDEPFGQKDTHLGRNLKVQEMPDHHQKIHEAASNRRETLHIEEAMEQDNLMSSFRDLQLKSIYPESNTGHMEYQEQQQSFIVEQPKEKQSHASTKSLYLNESIEEDIGVRDNFICKNVSTYPFNSKARKTLLLGEPIEEDVGFSAHLSSAEPLAKHEIYKPRSTLLMSEDINEEVVTIDKDLTKKSQYKTRKTLLLTEPIEEDLLTPSENEAEISLPKHKRSKARPTLLMSEDIEEDINPIKRDEVSSGKFSPVHTVVNKERPIATSSLLMSEPVEDDEVASHKDLKSILAIENLKSQTRKTLLLTEPIEEDFTSPKKVEPEVPLPKHKRSKARNTLLMAEDIEEDIVAPRKDFPISSLCEGFQSKGRSTLLLVEPIEQDGEICGIPSPIGPLANKGRPIARSKLLVSKPVEVDVVASHKELKPIPAIENPKSKTRNTLLLTEPIEEDFMSPKKVEPEVPLSKHKRCRARNTLLLAEDIEEDIVAPREDFPFAPLSEGFQSKARSTLLLGEPIEEDVETSGKLYPVHTIANKGRSISRSTLLMSEAVEDDVEASFQGLKTIPAIENPKSKTRNTLLLTEPIEEDFTSPKKIEPEVPLSKHKRSKARNTLLLAEDIEEDIVAPREDFPLAPLCKDFKSKEPKRQDEEISEKPSLVNPKTNHERIKTSNAFPTVEPIDRNIVDSHKNLPTIPPSKGLKHKTRNTLLLSEPMEEEILTANQNLSLSKHKRSKARSTLLMAEAIEEDKVPVNLSMDIDGMVSGIQPVEPGTPQKPKNKTTVYTEDALMDDDVIIFGEDLPKGVSSKHQSSKARHTLLLSEKIEIDTPVATHKGFAGVQPFNDISHLSEFHRQGTLPRNQKEEVVIPHQNLKSFASVECHGAEIATENSMKEENKLKIRRTPPRSAPLKENAQQQDMDLDLAATPQNKPKRICNRIAMTPFRSPVEFENWQSLIEFEDKETALKSPHRASCLIGTPLARVKRSHKQLTPNLPQSKKHQGLFDDHIKTMQDQLFDVDETVPILRDDKRNQNQCKNKSSISMYEDKCITISDVSNYFEIQRNQQCREENEDGRKEQQQEQPNESLDLEIPSCGIQTYSKFINITGDTIVIPLIDESIHQEIDKVRLSLVSNLIEEDVDKNEPSNSLDLNPLPTSSTTIVTDKEVCLDMTLNPPVEAGTSSSCRKCNNCRRSLSNTNISSDSFALPPLKEWNITRDLERLELVRQKPHFMDIQKYFQLKEQEVRHSMGMEEGPPIADQTQLEKSSFTHPTNSSEMIQLFQTLGPRCKPSEETVHCKESLQSLDFRLATEQPEWNFNYQLGVSRKLLLAHQQFIRIFRIVMTYDFLDDMDMDMGIRISSIYIEPTRPPTSWLPFDHVLNYQLGLKLPLKLLDCLEGHNEESVAKFLQQINEICVNIRIRACQMAKAITSSVSTLIRQQFRTVVKKTSHIISPSDDNGILRIQEIEFVVEITNLEEISFKDIVQPQLYMFKENIQYLPKGVAFLEAFLPNPEQYLKQTWNQ